MLFMEKTNILIKKMICLWWEDNVTQMAPLYLRSVSGLPRLSFLHDLLGLMDVRNRILFEKHRIHFLLPLAKLHKERVSAMIQICLGSALHNTSYF